jgi:hypothetical protein
MKNSFGNQEDRKGIEKMEKYFSPCSLILPEFPSSI